MATVPHAFWFVSVLAATWILVAGLVVAWLRQRAQLAEVAHDRERLSDNSWELREAAEALHRAEAASQAKSRFLATVSHEVRTPLNGVLGVADLLMATPLSPEQQAYVGAMQTSGSALITLIDEILDFARIESGRLDLAPEPFDLAALVEGVVELLSPQAQDKGLEISAYLDDRLPPWLVGDGHRLRQVLLNLAGNAVKFTETGGVGVRVTAVNGGIAVSVLDTGPGIPADRRAAIFEDFEQVDGSTTRRHGGAGLGLAIAKRIVAGMGGALRLADRDGGGSAFSFTVALPTAANGNAARVPLCLDGQRALIVSGDLFQPAFLAEMLGHAGAVACLARTKEDALAQMSETRFDLLFVDCTLGEDVARRLAEARREHGIGRGVLLFSPFERRRFGQHLLAGYDAWLVKPVRRTSLAERLNESPEQIEVAPVSSVSAVSIVDTSRFSVLVAEDNPINALIARASLERLGADVTHAADGAMAVSLAKAAMADVRARFDLILMDISMPHLDGFDATRAIRAAESEMGQPATRIVAMTAHALQDSLAACRAAGMDDVLTKPVAPAAFRRLVAPENRLVEAS